VLLPTPLENQVLPLAELASSCQVASGKAGGSELPNAEHGRRPERRKPRKRGAPEGDGGYRARTGDLYAASVIEGR
jgi:hypothetical protein